MDERSRTGRRGRERLARSRPFALLLTLLGLAAYLVAVPASPAEAAVIDVTTTEDNVPGSLRAAMEEASTNGTNDVIDLQAGATYVVCSALGHRDHNRTLTINGNGATVRRQCPGGGDTHVGTISNQNKATLILRDLTVTGGSGGSFGAIRSIGATDGLTGDNELYLDDVRIVDNVGTSGGGAIFADGYVSIEDSEISGNVGGSFGGAIHMQQPWPTSGEALTITDSIIRDNEAGRGGGISLGSMSPGASIIGSVIADNRATDEIGGNGGGIHTAGNVNILWSSVTGNRSNAPGGGMLVGTLSLLGSTVSGNGGWAQPNGILALGEVNASFSTIVDNEGDNLRIDNGADLHAFATVIGGESGGSCWFTGAGSTTTSTGYNVEDGDDCGFGGGPGDRTDVDDLGLHPLADNGEPGLSHHPTWSGGLIDTIPASNPGCASILFGFDQRGVDRPKGEGCEPGAIEFDPDRLPAHPFSDVPPWVEESVRWIWFHGIADGWADGTYRPDEDVTRAQFARMLYRLAGSPDVSGLPAHGLSDVPAWVEDAVRWIVHDPDGGGTQVPVMAGFADGTFRPNDPITRAQAVRALYRSAGAPDVSGLSAHGLSDVPAWVEDAVRWAAHDPPGALLPVMTGFADGTFRPNDEITRAQVTRALHRTSDRLATA